MAHILGGILAADRPNSHTGSYSGILDALLLPPSACPGAVADAPSNTRSKHGLLARAPAIAISARGNNRPSLGNRKEKDRGAGEPPPPPPPPFHLVLPFVLFRFPSNTECSHARQDMWSDVRLARAWENIQFDRLCRPSNHSVCTSLQPTLGSLLKDMRHMFLPHRFSGLMLY